MNAAILDAGEHTHYASISMRTTLDIPEELIGAIAAEHSAGLWSLDEALRRLARLRVLDLYDPAGRS
jgi:predicted nucleic acid-binding protein